MKRLIALMLAALLALSGMAALAANIDKDTVKAVQKALNDAGYDCGTPDGVAGKKTAAAITAYQEANGMEATGEIDDALLATMGLAEEPAEGTMEKGAEEATEGETETVEEAIEAGEEEQSKGTEHKPENFATLYNNTLYSYLLGSLGEEYADFLTRSFSPYIMTPLYDEEVFDDGSVIQEFSGGKGSMMIEGKMLEDGRYGRLESVTYTLMGKQTEELDSIEGFAVVVFMALCNEEMGGTIDDNDALSRRFGDASDGTVITAGWGPVFYECDAYTVNYEYINEGDADYEQEIKLTFTARQESGAEVDAEPDVSEAEVEIELPKELEELTGGFPDDINALSDKYDVDGIRALETAWTTDGMEAMTALLESGNCEIPTYGYVWEDAEFYKAVLYDGIVRSYSVAITTERAEDTLRLKLEETLPDENVDDEGHEIIHYAVDLSTPEGDGNTPDILIQAMKDTQDPSKAIETTGLFTYSLGDYGDYTNISVLFHFGNESYFVRLFATREETMFCWTGNYDEAGSLINIESNTRPI